MLAWFEYFGIEIDRFAKATFFQPFQTGNFPQPQQCPSIRRWIHQITCNEIVVIVNGGVESRRRHSVLVNVFDVDVQCDSVGSRLRGRHISDDDRDHVTMPMFMIERLQRHQRPQCIRRTCIQFKRIVNRISKTSQAVWMTQIPLMAKALRMESSASSAMATWNTGSWTTSSSMSPTSNWTTGPGGLFSCHETGWAYHSFQ